MSCGHSRERTGTGGRAIQFYFHPSYVRDRSVILGRRLNLTPYGQEAGIAATSVTFAVVNLTPCGQEVNLTPCGQEAGRNGWAGNKLPKSGLCHAIITIMPRFQRFKVLFTTDSEKRQSDRGRRIVAVAA